MSVGFRVYGFRAWGLGVFRSLEVQGFRVLGFRVWGFVSLFYVLRISIQLLCMSNRGWELAIES